MLVVHLRHTICQLRDGLLTRVGCGHDRGGHEDHRRGAETQRTRSMVYCKVADADDFEWMYCGWTGGALLRLDGRRSDESRGDFGAQMARSA